MGGGGDRARRAIARVPLPTSARRFLGRLVARLLGVVVSVDHHVRQLQGRDPHAGGDVCREDLPVHVCAFDAALIPAINPYASPLKLFEALAAGVVAVAPHQANLTEILATGENGLLFEPGSAASLGACLEDLVASPARARELGEAGRRSLTEHDWTWQGNARRVVAAYQELQP